MSNDQRYVESLRAALTGSLADQGALSSEAVVAAFRTVPRHLFVPDAPVEVAYADDVVLMKRDEAGVPISSVSQPSLVALMLEQTGVRRGHRVLEIGSGGYNAALLSELVGPEGEVTTIDIDPDVTERARATLDAAGYERVRVARTDGQFGYPESAPFDRIIVTVTAGDIAPAWVDQLADGGRIVVPLRLRGQTRSIGFDLERSPGSAGVLWSRSSVVCGFVSMQGAGAAHERLVEIEPDKVALQLDADQVLEAVLLPGVLRETPEVRWSRVLLGREESFCQLDLWLASVFPGYCVLTATRRAVKSRLVRPALRWGGSAVVRDATIGYLTSQPGPTKNAVEIGARAHGPDARRLAEELVAQVLRWDEERRGRPDPVFVVHPLGTPATDLPAGPHFTTRSRVITVLWD
ncbi:Protein-L-isoaspartate(D-aspartate) O-methyltransferase [Kribbella flavida DSM 17836]|uniref:Protein-L-isoaspartate O-methyltransferase n=1 Tax=Kribbella flavida (strain DSM 17836 / JCM 10339 / NBRC 14399) TaxID=479435 RepID=D2PVA4_KRIFD|nr:methyltransferase, FxLD system [Kribbella flavida]ADB33385.1 Protein-L-isoaspartate(D-aspartate) O-methyltransferase [Kribbella flavida DSM 17836]